MRLTSVITSKGRLTIPRKIREKLGVRKGTKIDIYLTENGFVGQVQRQSRILDFAGDLKKLDKGESFAEIRAKARARRHS